MQKSILLLFSLFIFLTSCNETKKTEETSTNTKVVEENTEYTIHQKIEKLEAQEFSNKMTELRVYNIVDVRTPKEFDQASIPRAKNIDINASNFEEVLDKLERIKPLLIYCKSGGRSAKAVEKAKEMGFERIIELDGGMESWKAAKMETAHAI
ncbi:rhodanese-like domain-containing protein [Bernardetia sp. Wsw4-3y2]|uniref:rhodanese-like domain-containing protein n=1 Tax=Bernardetia sp. Wsw4-3y2 TaxID=3127471 RepID=UPI0030CE8872